ncbi:MAG TPA: phosphoglycerate kinase [Candidatus Saccharimonadales bacterium]|nr:phosphoglycerate kinase [Candidatus Saccharimonadales bacterium]
MFTKQTIRDIDLKGKTVFLRADYNVPLQDGKITDDYRIQKSLPTVQYLLKHGVKLIICSHLGRPKGRVVPELSLFPVAKHLKSLLQQDVEFVPDCVGERVEKAAAGLKPGQVLLLENVRFHPEEESNDPAFAKQLAALADIFVQDAFGVVHHPAVSVSELPKYLPGVAGFLLEKEVDTITNVMENPERPLVAIIGGAKIADKIDILKRCIEIADFVAVGGAMANTFLVARGISVSESLYDQEDLPVAKDILKKAAAEAKKRRFIFAVPRDGVVTSEIDKTVPTRIVDWDTQVIADIENYPKRVPAGSSHIHAHEKIVDIGPFSGSFIAGGVQLANTVIWNGAMGITETKGLQGPIGPYAHGTELVIEALVGDFGHKPFTLVGGGDTVGYIEERGLVDHFNHVSTGGGASLELMAGRKLPGVEALMDKKSERKEERKVQ